MRGELYLAAQKRIESGKEVIFTNVGNPQALGQPSFTFNRRVLALLTAPFLLQECPQLRDSMPEDVIEERQSTVRCSPVAALEHTRTHAGSMESGRGRSLHREEDAPFSKALAEDIYLTNGASEAVAKVLQALLRGSHDCVLVPIPQYPLYSATVALMGGEVLPYHLDEDRGWALDEHVLEEAVRGARAKARLSEAWWSSTQAILQGQCMGLGDLEKIVRFCSRENIVLLADEVVPNKHLQGWNKVHQHARRYESLAAKRWA